jgi:peptide/nickel transport system permease protein
MSLPPILIALLLLYVLGGGTLNVILVLAVTRWPVYARLVRGSMLSLRERQFIEAIVQTGASDARVLIRHAIPNVARSVAVLATLEVAMMMLTEAGLDFLGLGVQPPNATWGLMLADGQQYITIAWWQITMPGLAILSTALAFNLLGTGMGRPGTSRPTWDVTNELASLRPG